MERHIITLDEHGVLHVPEVSRTAIWMNEPELMELFGVVAPTLRTAIKAVYKNGILNPGEAEQRVRQADGYGMDVLYGLPPACSSFRSVRTGKWCGIDKVSTQA